MLKPPINTSEAFVQYFCQKSFLSLWCHANPRGKSGKELCDILVVCDPDVIIISVKAVELGRKNDSSTEHERWLRRAVDAFKKQIFGAERWLKTASNVICRDGTVGIELPALDNRRTHRIAVAFGSREEVSIGGKKQPDGFVHVFTEQSLTEVFNELDTIQDFVDYLRRKEFFLSQGGIIVEGSESNLLGFYIHEGREFPKAPDFLMVQDGIWSEIQRKPEFIARKQADEVSYAWDFLIEKLVAEDGHQSSQYGWTLSEREYAIRVMARERRLSRRMLGEALTDFLRLTKQNKIRSRMMISLSDVIYVLAYFRKGTERRYRISELSARCLIARSKSEESLNTILGIGFCEFDPSIGSETDVAYFSFNEWTEKLQLEAQQLESEFGFFRNARMHRKPFDEFPTTAESE